MTETLVLERLTPQGVPDYEAKTMPLYLNETTREMGQLAELSHKPGTCWIADWIPGKPLLRRLPDGSTQTLELTDVHYERRVAPRWPFAVPNKPKRSRR